MAPPDDHDCKWKEYAAYLQQQLTAVAEQQRAQSEQLEALKKKVFGRSREKMPPMEREVRRGKARDAAAEQEARAANAAVREQKLTPELVPVSVPPAERQCPKCDATQLSRVSQGKPSTVIEYVAGYFRKRVFLRETLACRCGQYVVTAPVPDKVFDKTQYGPGFIAHLVVSKCCDSIPIYRIEQQFRRVGIPMARSTMNELFHRAGEVLAPLARRILALVAQAEIVHADETPHRLQDTRKKPYIWTFVSGDLIAYKFSMSRSGDTPKEVLGGTTGTLVVDMFTGYNSVTGVQGRQRAGCLAHARRRFFNAQSSAPEAKTALELVRELYVIEHDVKQARIIGNQEHARIRLEQSLPIMDKLYVWLAQQKLLHLPKSPMGMAIRYAMKNWQAMTRFITDARIAPDNNVSERALRVVALGRKTFLFVGSKEAGDNLAALYTVVATCLASGVDPLAYLSDVLIRVGSTPAANIDRLLPRNWVPPPG